MPLARLMRPLSIARSPPAAANRALTVAADATAPSPVRARPALPAPLFPGFGRPVAHAYRPSLLALSFVVLVVLPTVVAAAYWFAIAADQYVTEFRFTLNTADPPPFDPLSLLTGNATRSPAKTESQVLVQYITSRAIIDRIAGPLDVRQLFARPTADWWSRLSPTASVEELVHYWKGQVDPFYDPGDGNVTVRVRAFAPDDALRLAQAVVAACEALVNDLSQRARRDALGHAETDLAQAERRLKQVLGELSAFRDREGMIDPAKTAEATGLLATRLRDELLRAKAELATLQAYMRDSAPSVRVLQARIRSLEGQRRSLAGEMTDPDPARSGALSHVLGSYEQLESERKFAEAAYQHALQGLDQARANADRQHVFVASFVPPGLPEEPLYPRRWRALGVVALMAFALWGIAGLALQSIRDHLS